MADSKLLLPVQGYRIISKQNNCFQGLFVSLYVSLLGFPGSLAHKESTCNAGNPGSIPGSGRSPGEGIGHPLQYSWASLVAQMLKNLPAMREVWV